MTALALGSDAFRPQRPKVLGKGLALALIAHVLLVIVLAIGVNWRTSTEREGMEAELWAAVPQVAAPRVAAQEPATAPTPPPPSLKMPKPEPVQRVQPPPRPAAVPDAPDAKIAIEKAKREERKRQELADAQEEAERKARLKADKLAAAKQAAAQKKAELQADQAASAVATKKQELAAQKLEAQREANLQRMLAQAGSSDAPSPGRAAQNAGPSADYIGRIKGRIRPNVSFPNTLEGNPSVEVELRLAADGRILSARIVKPSGAREWDEAVQRGIEKTEMLPRDESGRAPPSFTLVYKLRD